MENKEKTVLDAMKNAGKPVKGAEVAESWFCPLRGVFFIAGYRPSPV